MPIRGQRTSIDAAAAGNGKAADAGLLFCETNRFSGASPLLVVGVGWTRTLTEGSWHLIQRGG